MDDIVTLGGQNFPINGKVTAAAVSDFEAGIKVGKVSYDNRENAFFLVLDDFTGGFGSRYLDIREELGTYWFASIDNAPETSYAGRVTLPLSQSYVSFPKPTAFDGNVSVGYPAIERSRWYVFSLGGGIYTLATLGGTPILRHDNTTPNVSIIAIADATEGEQRLYAGFNAGGTGGTPRVSFDDGETWSAIISKYITQTYPPIEGSVGDILKQDVVIQYQTGVTISTYTNPPITHVSPTYATFVGTNFNGVYFENYEVGPDAGGSEVEEEQPDTRIAVPNYTVTVYPYQLNENETPRDLSDLVTTATAYVPVEDLFAWDGKVLGQFDDNKLTFLVPGSGEGLAYFVIPPGNYAILGQNITVGSVQSGSTIHVYDNPPSIYFSPVKFNAGSYSAGSGYASVPSYSGGAQQTQERPDSYIVEPTFTTYDGYIVTQVESVGPDATKYYLDAGQEPWNHLIEGDEQIVAAADIERELRFIGVAAASWGEPAVYLRGGNRIYVLDFFSRKLFPVDIGANRPLIQGKMWQGAIVVTDGWNIYEYNPQAGTSRNIGLPSKWGIPPNLVGDSQAYQIIDIEAYDNELFAILVDVDDPATMLFKYNGLGWHQVGARMQNFFANHGFRVTFPLPGDLFTNRSQAFILPGTDHLTSPTGAGYWQFNLPTITHQPTVGLDTFGPSGARMHTGWIDGGFFDIDGTLLRLNIDAFFPSTSEKVVVEYRLDNDPTDEDTATWTQMVDSAGVADEFDSTTDALYFDNDTAPKAGIKFRTVQFRITLIRGSDATKSPEVRAFTLVYLKTPELRTQWTFQIDLNRMTEVDAGGVSTFYVDGSAATLYNVWNKLRELWTNEHVLLPFTVPSALGTSETLYVKLTAIPVTFDDFRTAVGGKGTIDIQLLEVVT